MEKININLLPSEFTVQEVKKAKFYKIQAIGVVAILLIIFLSSMTVALRILQNQNIKLVQAKLSQDEDRVSNLKDRQASLLLLKNRLTTIDQYLGTSSPQAKSFEMLNNLLPPSLIISSENINSSGEVSIVAVVPDSQILDNMIASLTTEGTNQGKISQVSLDSLSRGRENAYRISFKIKLK